uniref:Uncharacterized protein n=1 Tax=Arundo donax TaxID=35708 RepID=A0A0A9EDN6_ARUDO
MAPKKRSGVSKKIASEEDFGSSSPWLASSISKKD